MPAVQRQGDLNSAGGAATGGVASVRANGRPVVVNGTGVSAHAPWGSPHPPHAAASTTGGSGSVRGNGSSGLVPLGHRLVGNRPVIDETICA